MIYSVYVWDDKSHNVNFYKTDDISGLEDLPNVAINPDLNSVKGYNRQYWKIINKTLYVKTPEERLESDKFHQEISTDFKPQIVRVTVEKQIEIPFVPKIYYICSGITVLISFFIGYFVRG
jgi:hypothetical protein